jgi:Sec-independent protein translocase protein TatA
VSLSEMLFLGLLGLVIFGPKKLATVGQQAGATLARLKKISSEFQSQLEAEVSASPSDRPREQAPVHTSPVETGIVQTRMDK